MPAVNLTGSNQLVATAAPKLTYRGFSVRETTGNQTAVIRVFDGVDASGVVLDEVSLGPGESARESYGTDQTMVATVGIYVQVVSGAVAGSVRYA